MAFRETLIELARSFQTEIFTRFLRLKCEHFSPKDEVVAFDPDKFAATESRKVGTIEFDDTTSIVVVSTKLSQELTSRTGKKNQYDFAKAILKHEMTDAGLFVFYDESGCFRLSLVVAQYAGTRRTFSSFRRYTYYVSADLSNKTFINQMEGASFSSLEAIQEAFSVEAVSDDFYNAFKPYFDELAEAVQVADDTDIAHDLALLFVIRILFLGFVQKKGWLDGDLKFIQHMWEAYVDSGSDNSFYVDWLSPLFFEALNSPPGRKISFGDNKFSAAIEEGLQMAPYLNGELFKRKKDVDDRGLLITDEVIGKFFDFLFQYNFTVEENTLYDAELELNPEFLGIIFERIVNKEDGAIYTPRVEVDFMCRMALVKWLEKNSSCDKKDLYEFLFREGGAGFEFEEAQRQGDFSTGQIEELITLLENVSVCDPAAGSGAFEVGMLYVLEELLVNLYERNNVSQERKQNKPTSFHLRKAIIARSLYGAEVKRWAVWINQLRLWLTLFVDMPDEMKMSFTPLLPNLTFKVRRGDSLVQRIGDKNFPVYGHAELPSALKRQVSELRKMKIAFFNNEELDVTLIRNQEIRLFRGILNQEMGEVVSMLKRYEEERPLLGGDATTSKKENQTRVALRARLEELKAQSATLIDEPPFIWSIEFPEVFFEKSGFDIIIGNPPYLRQENIHDPADQLEPKEYKQALESMVRNDFQEHFGLKGKIAGRSDLYTYFYIRSLRLLNPNGIHVFICSNSWLDVGYGDWLQYFLLQNVPIQFIFDNQAKRSFANADINTVITVMGAPVPENEGVPLDRHIRFVMFRQPFEEVIFTENLIAIENATITIRKESFRIFPITVEDLLEGGSIEGNYEGDKWGGKYLRAPDIFFTILEKGKDKLVRLGNISKVRRGITTGANDFFYLEPLGQGSQPGFFRVRNGVGWEGEIEEELLKPVIKSPQECKTILVKPKDVKHMLFCCNHPKKALEGTRALEYIEWGEQAKVTIRSGRQKGEVITGYQNLTSLRNKRRWWSIGGRSPRPVLWPMIHHDRIGCFLNEYGFEVDHNLFEIEGDECPIVTSLFTSLVLFSRELFGRSNLGEGALKTEGIDIKKFLVLDPSYTIWTESFMSRIRDYTPESIFTESGIDPESNVPIAEQEPRPLPDRKALDDIVFDALELTEEERKDVYRAVCQLVWNRISKAKSVKKRK